MSSEQEQKKESEELVTKGYLDEKLEKFATKEYLDEKLETNLEATKEYLDLRLGEFKEEIQDEMRGQTARILQAVDRVLVPADTAEKDRAAHGALHAGIVDDIHDHDERIKKLELATS